MAYGLIIFCLSVFGFSNHAADIFFSKKEKPVKHDLEKLQADNFIEFDPLLAQDLCSHVQKQVRLISPGGLLKLSDFFAAIDKMPSALLLRVQPSLLRKLKKLKSNYEDLLNLCDGNTSNIIKTKILEHIQFIYAQEDLEIQNTKLSPYRSQIKALNEINVEIRAYIETMKKNLRESFSKPERIIEYHIKNDKRLPSDDQVSVQEKVAQIYEEAAHTLGLIYCFAEKYGEFIAELELERQNFLNILANARIYTKKETKIRNNSCELLILQQEFLFSAQGVRALALEAPECANPMPEKGLPIPRSKSKKKPFPIKRASLNLNDKKVLFPGVERS